MIYEMYGREHEAHLRTLQLLRELKSGVLTLDRLEIEGNAWRVLPAPTPPMPPAVDGKDAHLPYADLAK